MPVQRETESPHRATQPITKCTTGGPHRTQKGGFFCGVPVLATARPVISLQQFGGMGMCSVLQKRRCTCGDSWNAAGGFGLASGVIIEFIK